MSPDLFGTALGILHLTVLFLTALFLPITLQLLLLFAASWAFLKLTNIVSMSLVRLFDLIGVPIHEFSHALARWITLCGVAALNPLPDPVTGVASTTPKRTHFLGNIVSSLAPLFGGMLVLWLLATYAIPGFQAPTVPPPQLDLGNTASLGAILHESIDHLSRFLRTVYSSLPSLEWSNWRTYAGLFMAFSVGIALAPSSGDLKNLARGLPIAIILVLALFTWLYTSGDAESSFLTLQEALALPLFNLTTAITYAFVLTSVGALLILPLAVLKRLNDKR
jgi:hypothetical protein